MVLKHLVISGGGPTLIHTLGAIQYLSENNVIDMDVIESIYATSAGAVIAIILCLKFSWDVVDDYILNRPWHNVFDININVIFGSYSKRGLFGKKTIEKCIKPLFDAKDVDIEITLSDFFASTKIDLHFFSFEINEFKLIDISHKTHPTLSVLQALHMTSAIPIIIAPVCIDGKCYIDGGIVCNYPLLKCVEHTKELDNIIGFKNHYENYGKDVVNEETNIFDFIMNFLFKLVYNLSSSDPTYELKHEIVCNTKMMSLTSIRSTLSSHEVRKKMFNDGIETSKQFLQTFNQLHV
jgi:predicted acylesterase/phospholipase RssA